MSPRALPRLAFATLVYNLLVMLWGTFVRATGSGAGCGAHWPMCNGVVLPRSPTTQTLVEFTHRVTSGLSLVLVLALVIVTFRGTAKGHPLRAGAVASGVFIVTEAAIGAGLVLLRLVAGNTSVARAWYLALHLTNTFFLLAALTLSVWWASGGRRVSPRARPGVAIALAVGILGGLLVIISGGIAALGDTLFPVRTLAEGIALEFSPTAHVFVRLRIWHPLVAVVTGAYLVAMAWSVRYARPSVYATRLALTLTALVVVQLGLGVLNVFLLAPVWMQLVHLAHAHFVWIALVLLAATSLAIDD